MKTDESVIMRIKKYSKEWCLLSSSKSKALVQKKHIYGLIRLKKDLDWQ